MKINGTNIGEIPGMLTSISRLIESLIEVTDVCATTPSIGYKSELLSCSAHTGIMYEARFGECLAIWAGGVDISDVANTATWDRCNAEAALHFEQQQAEHRNEAAKNRADILANK